MEDDFFEIYEETYPTIVRYVVSKIDNILNVSDIVQNIYANFYKVYKKTINMFKIIKTSFLIFRKKKYINIIKRKNETKK